MQMTDLWVRHAGSAALYSCLCLCLLCELHRTKAPLGRIHWWQPSCQCDTMLDQACAYRQLSCGSAMLSALHLAAACVCVCCEDCLRRKAPLGSTQGWQLSCQCDMRLGQACAYRQLTCGSSMLSALHSAAPCVCACCVDCIEGKRPMVAAVMARCTGALAASRLPAWKVLLAGGGCSAITSSTTSTTGFLPVTSQCCTANTSSWPVLCIAFPS